MESPLRKSCTWYSCDRSCRGIFAVFVLFLAVTISALPCWPIERKVGGTALPTVGIQPSIQSTKTKTSPTDEVAVCSSPAIVKYVAYWTPAMHQCAANFGARLWPGSLPDIHHGLDRSLTNVCAQVPIIAEGVMVQALLFRSNAVSQSRRRLVGKNSRGSEQLVRRLLV